MRKSSDLLASNVKAFTTVILPVTILGIPTPKEPTNLT